MTDDYSYIPWVNSAQAAEILGKSTGALYQMCDRGQIGFRKPGRHYIFTRADLVAYLQQGRVPPPKKRR